jgi:hypothetical protein
MKPSSSFGKLALAIAWATGCGPGSGSVVETGFFNALAVDSKALYWSSQPNATEPGIFRLGFNGKAPARLTSTSRPFAVNNTHLVMLGARGFERVPLPEAASETGIFRRGAGLVVDEEYGYEFTEGGE